MAKTRTQTEGLIRRIEASLDSIRPYLLADGGDVKVLDVTDRAIVRLEFMGACGSCPMSPMTFKAGIEQAILRDVPEVKGIEVLNLAQV
jgi:Fe-S cluster biogenesis protein NfuA